MALTIEQAEQPDKEESEYRAVRRMIKRLPTNSSVRQVTEDILDRPEQATDVQPLLDALVFGHPQHWRERYLAAWLLGRAGLDPARKQDAADVLRRVLECKIGFDENNLVLVLHRSMPFALLGGLLWSLLMLLSAKPHTFDPISFLIVTLVITPFLAVPFYLIVLPISLSLDSRHGDRIRATAAATLGRLTAPESVGALAAALYDNSAIVRQAALPALRAVLPTLSPAFYGRLPAGTVANLCRTLRYKDESLVLEVLAALEKVGDGSAVEMVERLTTRGRTDSIRQEAERILPMLQERQQQETAPTTLLRASQPDVEGLLLASVEARQAGQETLLRPGLSERGTNER